MVFLDLREGLLGDSEWSSDDPLSSCASLPPWAMGCAGWVGGWMDVTIKSRYLVVCVLQIGSCLSLLSPLGLQNIIYRKAVSNPCLMEPCT